MEYLEVWVFMGCRFRGRFKADREEDAIRFVHAHAKRMKETSEFGLTEVALYPLNPWFGFQGKRIPLKGLTD